MMHRTAPHIIKSLDVNGLFLARKILMHVSTCINGSKYLLESSIGQQYNSLDTVGVHTPDLSNNNDANSRRLAGPSAPLSAVMS